VKIVKLNVDESAARGEYGIQSIRTDDSSKSGQMASRQIGAVPSQKLEQWITTRCDAVRDPRPAKRT